MSDEKKTKPSRSNKRLDGIEAQVRRNTRRLNNIAYFLEVMYKQDADGSGAIGDSVPAPPETGGFARFGLIAAVAFLSLAVTVFAGWKNQLTRLDGSAVISYQTDSGGEYNGGMRITGYEATDAHIDLYADEADDNADKWTIRSEASGNALAFENNGTDKVTISSAGALVIAGGMMFGGDITLQKSAKISNTTHPVVQLVFTNTTATLGQLVLNTSCGSNTIANSDVYEIIARAPNTYDADTDYALIRFTIGDKTQGAEDGTIVFVIEKASTATSVLTLSATGATVIGDVSGTTIGGITEANLVDKTAAETVTGIWNMHIITNTALHGCTIGAVEPSTGAFTTLTANSLDERAADTLEIGAVMADRVEIADTGIITDIEGPVALSEGGTLAGVLYGGSISNLTSLYLGAVRWDDGSSKIDGEQLADNTVDSDAMDPVQTAFTAISNASLVVSAAAVDEAAAATLEIGGAQATRVEIADTGIITDIEGPVALSEGGTLAGVLYGGSISNLTAFYLGAVRWDDGSSKIDGEQLANDTVDDDSIDFGDVTLDDFTDADALLTYSNATVYGTVNMQGHVITNGALYGCTVGAVNPAPGAFTSLAATSFTLNGEAGIYAVDSTALMVQMTNVTMHGGTVWTQTWATAFGPEDATPRLFALVTPTEAHASVPYAGSVTSNGCLVTVEASKNFYLIQWGKKP